MRSFQSIDRCVSRLLLFFLSSTRSLNSLAFFAPPRERARWRNREYTRSCAKESSGCAPSERLERAPFSLRVTRRVRVFNAVFWCKRERTHIYIHTAERAYRDAAAASVLQRGYGAATMISGCCDDYRFFAWRRERERERRLIESCRCGGIFFFVVVVSTVCFSCGCDTFD